MALPFTSLDEATAVSDGVAKDLECPLANHTMIVRSSTGGLYDAVLEGSHDGVVWMPLAPVSSNGAVESHHVVRFVRARLSGIDSGSPTVTATIAST